jgi:hypothetical protein
VKLTESQLRVLRPLRRAGREGLTTNELLAAGAGSRFSARLYELRGMGFEITERRVKHNQSRYKLAKDIDAERGSSLNPDSPSSESAAVSLGADGPRKPHGAQALVGAIPPATAGQGALTLFPDESEPWREVA